MGCKNPIWQHGDEKIATTIIFDTPKTSTARPVGVTGTVEALSIGYLTITLNVNTTYNISIVPKVSGADTVEAV